ncbi:MAG: IPT/TIG domain-containing protein [Actinomycetota bacterium]|nr:IPT/TIG domain-containing protein [Actinomycetota bacterium]
MKVIALSLLFLSLLFFTFLSNDPNYRVKAASEGWYEQNSGTQGQFMDIECVDNNIVWAAGCETDGTHPVIRRSIDGGLNWEDKVTANIKDWAFSLSPIDGDIAWMTCPNSFNKTFKTSDGGSTWEEKDNPFSAEVISAPAEEVVWAVRGSIHRTIDDGVSWDNFGKFPSGACYTDIYAINEYNAWSVGFIEDGAGGYYGFALTTTDGGDNWQIKTFESVYQLFGICAIDQNTAWAVGHQHPTGYAQDDTCVILKTVDGGSNWIDQSEEIPGTLKDIAAIDKDTAWAVGWVPKDGGSDGIILKTVDGGENWIVQKSDIPDFLNAVTAYDKDTAWVAGYSGTILKTTDGGWNQPRITEIYPSQDIQGSEVTIEGSGFHSPRGQSFVSFGSEASTEYLSWSDSQIKCKVPENLCGEYAVTVSSYGGISNPVNFDAVRELYFAEGCTREGFSEWLSIQNPSKEEIEISALYMMPNGITSQKSYLVPETSRISVNVNEAVGPGKDVSVKLWAAGDFYAERPMYFIYKEGIGGYSWADGHVAAGVSAPRKNWYFAEGCTRTGFEEWLCIQNPNDSEVRVGIDYISGGSYTAHKDYNAPANSRISVFVNGDMGPGQDVSSHVYCDLPIVVERPMYFEYHPTFNAGNWPGGHNVIGVDSPQKNWYFSEGCTRPGFETWLCIQNPNDNNANLTINYATNKGDIVKEYVVPANSRYTLNFNRELGQDLDIACLVLSDENIICERPMYFNYSGMGAPGWTGGTDVLGVPSPKTAWYFPEGYTGSGFHEWLCLNNASTNSAIVEITYNILGETPKTVTHNVPPGRYTVFVNNDAGADLQFSMEITSSEPITAERTMYFSYNGVWNGGHCSTGFYK